MYVLPQFLCTFVLLICHTSHGACHSVYCLTDPERNVTVFFPSPGSPIQRLACIKDWTDCLLASANGECDMNICEGIGNVCGDSNLL